MITHNTLALDLILVGSGGLTVAAYLLYGYRLIKKNPDAKPSIDKGFALAIGLIGVLCLIGTLQLFLTEWVAFPVIEYTELYGNSLAIFSALLIMGSLILYTGSDLRPVSYLGAVGGVVMFQSARAVLVFGLSKEPVAAAVLFVLAGLAAISFLPATHIPLTHRASSWFRVLVALLLVGMSLVALLIGVMATYGHIESAITV